MKHLSDQIRETAFSLHTYLRHGHLEKVYENGLAHRLRKGGFTVQQQIPIRVRDEDGTILGDYIADMLVEHCIIVEVKAVRAIANEHIAQILGYLKAGECRDGLLVNFGAPVIQIRKFVF